MSQLQQLCRYYHSLTLLPTDDLTKSQKLFYQYMEELEQEGWCTQLPCGCVQARLFLQFWDQNPDVVKLVTRAYLASTGHQIVSSDIKQHIYEDNNID